MTKKSLEKSHEVDKPKKILSKKEEIFVREYLIDLNAAQACLRAGYKTKTPNTVGGKVYRRPHVRAEIEKALQERKEKTEITQQYVLEVIKETIERCRQVSPVLDRQGNQVYTTDKSGNKVVPAFTFESKGVLKGCELLGRHLIMWGDVGSARNPSTTNPNNKTIHEYTDAELIEIMNGGKTLKPKVLTGGKDQQKKKAVGE